MSDKTILEQWRSIAYDQQADRNKTSEYFGQIILILKKEFMSSFLATRMR